MNQNPLPLKGSIPSSIHPTGANSLASSKMGTNTWFIKDIASGNRSGGRTSVLENSLGIYRPTIGSNPMPGASTYEEANENLSDDSVEAAVHQP